MPGPDRELLTQAAYARRRGVTKQAVGEAVSDGRITLVGGLVDVAKADSDWEDGREERAGTASTKRAAARARREEAQAELAELELAEARGRVRPVEDFERAGFDVAREARDAFDKMIEDLRPALTPAAYDTVRKAVRAVLEKLAASV